MWFDPLAKWRAGRAGEGRAELLDGRFEEARALFETADDLVGQGDALLLLGRETEAVTYFHRAVERESGPITECGLSQALILQGLAEEAVRRLRLLHVDDPVVRHHLAAALLATADQVRSVTRDDELVITSRKQIDTCAGIADEVARIAVDETHLAAAHRLQSELAAGQRWEWTSETAVIGLSLLVVVIGAAIVTIGGVTGQVVLVVAGAVLGAAALYGIVIAHRRRAWQLQAAKVANLVWRHGV
jgi:hypothetical protein